MISACKTGSAKRVTAVLPLFPYSRQPDLPYNKVGAPLSKPPTEVARDKYTFESVPATPGPGVVKTAGFNRETDLARVMSKTSLSNGMTNGLARTNSENYFNGNGSVNGNANGTTNGSTNGDTSAAQNSTSTHSRGGSYTTHDYENPGLISTFQAKPGYKRWVAQAGTLVADLLTCAGADQYVCPLTSGQMLPFLKIHCLQTLGSLVAALRVSNKGSS